MVTRLWKIVLIPGAGLVVKPMVEFFLERNFVVMIATTTIEKNVV
jgi:hypothetical protein